MALESVSVEPRISNLKINVSLSSLVEEGINYTIQLETKQLRIGLVVSPASKFG